MTTAQHFKFRRRPTFGGVAFRILIAVLYLFLLAPLFIMVVLSFSSNQYISFPPKGFTLEWYARLPSTYQFMDGLQTSLITASVATVVVLLLGVPVALAISRFHFKGKAAIQAFFLSPLLVPTIVTALGLLLLLGPMGRTNTYFSIILGHTAITIPYVIRTTLISLQTSETSCEDAARVLGASGLTVFRRITLPIIAPGVISGGVLAFIVSFDELVVSLFVAESGKPTLPVHIMRYVENSADAVVAALSVILILFSILIVVVVERLTGLRKSL